MKTKNEKLQEYNDDNDSKPGSPTQWYLKYCNVFFVGIQSAWFVFFFLLCFVLCRLLLFFYPLSSLRFFFLRAILALACIGVFVSYVYVSVIYYIFFGFFREKKNYISNCCWKNAPGRMWPIVLSLLFMKYITFSCAADPFRFFSHFSYCSLFFQFFSTLINNKYPNLYMKSI